MSLRHRGKSTAIKSRPCCRGGGIYQYAFETLDGILYEVRAHKLVTRRQMTAIDNIEAAPSNEDDHDAYDGYRWDQD